MALNRAKVVQEAERFVAKGRIASAIKEYRRLLAENPDDVSTLNRVGDLYVQNNQTDEAIRLFWDVAERYTQDGFHTRAIAIFKKVIRTDPTRLDAYERLAELYAHERLVNDALQQYQVLVEYYLKHANPVSAAKILQKMAAVQPEDPSLLLRLAELYEKQQLHDKALAEYRKIAELMLRHGKGEEAHKVFARALELAPTDLNFVTEMVLGLKDAGHLGLAARLLTRAVELNPLAERIARMTPGLGRPAAPPVAAPPAPSEAPAAGPPVAAPPVEVVPPEPAPPSLGPPMAAPARPAVPVAPPAAGEDEFEVILAGLEDDSALIPGMGALELLPPIEMPRPPAPARPEAAEEEFEIELLGFDDAVPSTLVTPPPDMQSPVGSSAPMATREEGEPLEFDFDLELEAPPAPPAATSPPPTAEAELPPDIEWSFQDAGLELDLQMPELTEAVLPALAEVPPVPEPAAPPANGLTTVPLDTAALERTVQEIQRKPPPREAELLAEAEVFAKYELNEKALDRVRGILQMNPRHLGALALAVQLHLKEGKPERVMARAQQLARAASEAGKPEAWTTVRQRLIHAGYDLSGEGLGPEAGRSKDGLSQLVDSLVAAPERRAPASRKAPAKPGKRIEAELDLLASQVLAKPGKAKPRPAPAAPRASEGEAAPSLPPPAVPIPPPAPVELAHAAEPRLAPPVEELLPGVPAAPLAEPPGLGTVDEEELPGIRIPMKASAVPLGTPSTAARPAASADELNWLDEAIANAPAAKQADEKLFDDEEGFFDLAAELEQELSRDELFAGDDLVPMPKEPSLEEIVEGFKKGVAESLSPEDVDTHYNLGIAYREMGLLDDAIGEFQVAAKDPRYLVECSSMLGICFLDKGMPELAVKWYRRALESPGLPEETALGLLYDLGTAQMAAGDKQAARETFTEVYGADANYRDIAAVLAELGADA